jgi:hypothetical protein
MARIARILVAVKTPSSRRQVPMLKAAILARATGARLLLFHAITQPLMVDAWSMGGESLQDMQKRWKATVMKQLEKLAEGLRESGLKVDCDCTWDFPAYEAVVRWAVKSKVDLIVAERHEYKRVMPWLLRFNDWEMIRRSPVPMLLMLALAPLLGLAFVIFLPFIGFAMAFRLAGEKAIEAGGRAAAQGARVLRPGWAPALAFLARTLGRAGA